MDIDAEDTFHLKVVSEWMLIGSNRNESHHNRGDFNATAAPVVQERTLMYNLWGAVREGDWVGVALKKIDRWEQGQDGSVYKPAKDGMPLVLKDNVKRFIWQWIPITSSLRTRPPLEGDLTFIDPDDEVEKQMPYYTVGYVEHHHQLSNNMVHGLNRVYRDAHVYRRLQPVLHVLISPDKDIHNLA